MKKILVIINDIDPNIYLNRINKEKFFCTIIYQLPTSPAMQKKFDTCMDLLEEFEWISVRSKEDLLVKAEEIALLKRFDTIVAYAEDLIVPVEKLKMEMDMFNQYESIKNITNKYYQRSQIFGQYPELSGYYFEFTKIEDINKVPSDLSYPGILKPVSMAGSRGVIKINDFNELERQIKKLENEQLLKSGFVFEEFFEGSNWYDSNNMFDDYVSVESIVSNGKITHLTVSSKPMIAKPFRETGLVMPTTLPKKKQDVLFKAAEKVILALGFLNGPTHIELKLTKSGPKLIEFNPRAGGPVPYMLQVSSEYEIINNIFNSYLGEEIDPLIRLNKATGFFSFQIGEERKMEITHINDKLNLNNDDRIKEFFIFKHEGDIIYPHQGTSAMVAFAYVIEDTPEKCIFLRDEISSLLDIKYKEI